MSDFDSLREDLARALETIQHAGDANVRAWTANVDDHTAIWCDIGDLRDELHALANRVESLMRARLTEPAEVAEAMVRKYGVPCSECGVPVYVDHLDPRLPSPIRNAADGTPHTCHIRVVPNG